MKQMTFLVALLVLSLAACAPVQATPAGDPRGDAVYINSTDLLVAESYPVQIFLHITGELPTPCHEFRSQVAAPDEQNRIFVTAWSESNPAAICVQMLEPFEISVPVRMDGVAEGTYTVWLNSELVGEFSYPA